MLDGGDRSSDRWRRWRRCLHDLGKKKGKEKIKEINSRRKEI
jgi:hypothetical protein